MNLDHYDSTDAAAPAAKEASSMERRSQDKRREAELSVEYEEIGSGPALVLVPGSCSTGAAWRPVAAHLKGRFRCITTSLPGYGRTEEYAADRHGIDILRRAGYSPEIMVDTLNWLRRISGDGGGGFLSTHPAIDERIAALRKLP